MITCPFVVTVLSAGILVDTAVFFDVENAKKHFSDLVYNRLISHCEEDTASDKAREITDSGDAFVDGDYVVSLGVSATSVAVTDVLGSADMDFIASHITDSVTNGDEDGVAHEVEDFHQIYFIRSLLKAALADLPCD